MFDKTELKKKFHDHKFEIAAISTTILAAAATLIIFDAYKKKSDVTNDEPFSTYPNKNWIRVQIARPDIETMLSDPNKVWYSTNVKPYIELSIIDSY